MAIKVDGIFGQETEDAVKAFQTKEGLKVDGVVGPETWTALDLIQTANGILETYSLDGPEDAEWRPHVQLPSLSPEAARAVFVTLVWLYVFLTLVTFALEHYDSATAISIISGASAYNIAAAAGKAAGDLWDWRTNKS